MVVELRCDSRILFGILGDGVLEVKCRSDRCADRRPGTVVIHQFSTVSGVLLATSKFKDPATRKVGGSHGSE